ncbi:chemerin-like receptor 1 [Emydura macquarii macquarii]|uniref:chemerin-like receptor 1 n=1 Tax=Emydura macquarii macquarii TaxID=1129001 RepID=UPI003529FF55
MAAKRVTPVTQALHDVGLPLVYLNRSLNPTLPALMGWAAKTCCGSPCPRTACTYHQVTANEEAAHLPGVALLETMNLAPMMLCAPGFLLGVMGNGLTILITGWWKKKTVNATWHLNMAIAAFIFAIFLPIMVAQLAMGFHWYLRSVLCKITNIVTALSTFSSSFHLTAMSTDRCISTVFPVWVQNHRTVHLASLIALGIWILAVMASWHYHGLCSDQSLFLRERGEAANVGTRFLVGFLAPLALISLCLVWKMAGSTLPAVQDTAGQWSSCGYCCLCLGALPACPLPASQGEWVSGPSTATAAAAATTSTSIGDEAFPGWLLLLSLGSLLLLLLPCLSVPTGRPNPFGIFHHFIQKVQQHEEGG